MKANWMLGVPNRVLRWEGWGGQGTNVIVIAFTLFAVERALGQVACEVYCDGSLFGNGTRDTPEQCYSDFCQRFDTLPTCGCLSLTGCTADGASVLPPPVCGNGRREGMEECDPAGGVMDEADCRCPGQCRADCTCPGVPHRIGTSFTYQGTLEKPVGTPLSGTCDFRFGLWDDPVAGALVSAGPGMSNPTNVTAINVSAGVFAVTLDFGEDVFNDAARWLAIEVRCPPGVGAYSMLSPRVRLTPAPLALALPGLYAHQSASYQDITATKDVAIRDHALVLSNTPDSKDWLLDYDEAGNYFFIDEYGFGRRLAIANGGNVGIGTTAPTAKLHVNAGSSKGVRIDNSGSGLTAPALHVVNTNASGVAAWMANSGTDATLVLQNDKTAGDAIIRAFGPLGTFVAFEVETVSGVGRVGINRDNPAYPLHVGTSTSNGNGAHVTVGGAWTNGSSRDFKENFEPIDKQEILRKLVELPMTQWRYKNESDARNLHIGPVAEDFSAAFGLGHDERYITTVDADGVALAAIQALHQIVQEKDCEIEDQRAQLEEEKNQIRELQLRLARIEAMLSDTSIRGGKR